MIVPALITWLICIDVGLCQTASLILSNDTPATFTSKIALLWYSAPVAPIVTLSPDTVYQGHPAVMLTIVPDGNEFEKVRYLVPSKSTTSRARIFQSTPDFDTANQSSGSSVVYVGVRLSISSWTLFAGLIVTPSLAVITVQVAPVSRYQLHQSKNNWRGSHAFRSDMFCAVNGFIVKPNIDLAIVCSVINYTKSISPVNASENSIDT